jgi:hypothetical protein
MYYISELETAYKIPTCYLFFSLDSITNKRLYVSSSLMEQVLLEQRILSQLRKKSCILWNLKFNNYVSQPLDASINNTYLGNRLQLSKVVCR